MGIIQFGSNGTTLILEEQIKYLLSDVVGIGGDVFFVCKEVHDSISLVLDHGEYFVSLVSTQSSIVGTISLFPNFPLSRGLVKFQWICFWHRSIDHLQVDILTNKPCIVVYQFVVLYDISLLSQPYIWLVRQVPVSQIVVVETGWSCYSRDT